MYREKQQAHRTSAQCGSQILRSSILPLFCLFGMAAALAAQAGTTNVPGGNGDKGGVTLGHKGGEWTLQNGNVAISLNGSDATVTSMRYHNVDFIPRVGKHDQIYWSMDGGDTFQTPKGAVCTVKADTPDMADVGCKEKYDGSQPHAVDIEIHYVLRRGATGLYAYAILSHPASYPDTSVGEWRIVWTTPQVGNEWLLERIFVDQRRHWLMPTPTEYAQEIHTPIKEISFFRSGPWQGKGESKYTYNATYEDIGTFGFASDKNKLGAWTVIGGFDYYNDGPRKQDLTALQGGMTHHFGRNHFGGSTIQLAKGEDWSKIFGPFLLYLNSGGSADELWHDAQRQAAAEQAAWPYAWLKDVAEYPVDAGRGSARGHFSVKDSLRPAQTGAGAWIGLAQPPAGTDFQFESKNYEYWSRVAPDGTFTIPHVRPGTYTLYAFMNGEVGQYVQSDVHVAAGGTANLGEVAWSVPRAGRSIAWEIGYPDRDSTEFRHGNEYFMPYLYKAFALEMPNPLIYTVGQSKPNVDWNYAQTAYRAKDAAPVPWTWRISFNLDSVPSAGEASLILACAGANKAHLQVSVNDGKTVTEYAPDVNVSNVLLRQGSHAKYSTSRIAIPVSSLKQGMNTIDLTMNSIKNENEFIMWDYLGMEMP